jgi:ABC-type microcin C transport system duplicated ATPase subunit YejF
MKTVTITISGQAGSGKTVAAKRVFDALPGDVFVKFYDDIAFEGDKGVLVATKGHSSATRQYLILCGANSKKEKP